MANWNISGDFNINEGGYGHEKCFATSHMWCTKYQEIDLTEHFSIEYLDTAPAIEVRRLVLKLLYHPNRW